MHPEPRHQCFIYEGSPSTKLGTLAAILLRKLNAGYRCMYLNSAPMVAGMRSTLAALGLDVQSEIDKGGLILSSEPVSPGNDFNSDDLLGTLEDALDEALKDGYKGLWASADMTWEFGSAKNFSKLMEYELKLEELFNRRNELCGICQYHRDTLPEEAVRQGLLVHPNVVISETLTIINPHYLQSSWPVDETTHLQIDKTISALCSQQGI